MVTFAYRYLHLVSTDVLMPEVDGRVLGHRLRERSPELPVLYISAYPADDLFHRGAPTAAAPLHAEADYRRRTSDRSPGAPDGPGRHLTCA